MVWKSILKVPNQKVSKQPNLFPLFLRFFRSCMILSWWFLHETAALIFTLSSAQPHCFFFFTSLKSRNVFEYRYTKSYVGLQRTNWRWSHFKSVILKQNNNIPELHQSQTSNLWADILLTGQVKIKIKWRLFEILLWNQYCS